MRDPLGAQGFSLEHSLSYPEKYNSQHVFSASDYLEDFLHVFNIISSSLSLQNLKLVNYPRKYTHIVRMYQNLDLNPKLPFIPLHLAAACRGKRSLRSEELASDHKTQMWQKHDSNPGLSGFTVCGRCHCSLHSALQRWSRLTHADHRVSFPGFPLTVQHAECENTL